MRRGRMAVESEQQVQALLVELKACSSSKNLDRGRRLHAEAVQSGLDSCIYVANTLVDMYSKCSAMPPARRAFDSIELPTVVSWNALISGYAGNGEGLTALDLFTRMRTRGCAPNSRTFVAALKACTALSQEGGGGAESLKRGKQIHLLASETGCVSHIYVQNALIDMYSKCRSMLDAREIFTAMNRPDVVSWTALILGYATNGEGETALGLFAKMRSQGCVPDSRTFLAALKACSSLASEQEGRLCRDLGKQIHLLACGKGCDSDMYVQGALIDMYAKCGYMEDALTVFSAMKHPDVVSWNALILGYAANGEGLKALGLFSRMKLSGCAPDAATFVAALKACTCLALQHNGNSKLACRDQGRQIHSLASEIGCDSCIHVQNTLIDMYSKCSTMLEAQRVFDGMKDRDVVSWTALILGYASNGEGVTALDVFAKMRSQGCAPDTTTFAAALKACGSLGALEAGRSVHADAGGIEHDVILVNSLVDFYAKCGSLNEAQKVFDLHPRTRNLTTWTALLAGYSRLGDAKAVFELFQGLQDAGFRPDAVTFTCLLTCCSHAGLVHRGKECFDSMSFKFGVVPSIEHYTCMADILARSNNLDDAMDLLKDMPCRPNVVTWMTILAACRKWRNVEIARLVFQHLLSLDESNIPAYVLMEHIYASRGIWKEKEMVLAMRKKLKCAWRNPGRSWWTDRAGRVHTFLACMN